MNLSVPVRSERVYLTGFMGSGKSTIGPILANALGYAFVDLDMCIEQREGCSIAELFRTRGEPAFRAIERTVLREVAKPARAVIALGGGTLVDPTNFQFIRDGGVVVYLNVPPDEILRRMKYRNDRPLLADDDGGRLPEGRLREKILALHTARAPLYERADIIVVPDPSRLGVTVDTIVRKLRPFLL
jgi:shikimate kinase